MRMRRTRHQLKMEANFDFWVPDRNSGRISIPESEPKSVLDFIPVVTTDHPARYQLLTSSISMFPTLCNNQ